MENRKNLSDLKNIIIISISIFAFVLSLFNVTYAFFSDSKNQPMSIKSSSSFGESTVYDLNLFIEGNLTTTTKIKNNQPISYSKDNVENNDYLLTIATQVEPHTTEYELDEYTSISYEIYHKTDETLDTSSFTCTDNKYNNGTKEDYCNTGTFIENSLEGLPFELIKDFRIKDTNTHYFDVYIYLNNNTTSKKIKTKIYYLDKAVEKEILEYKQELLKGNDPDLTTGLIPVVYDDTKGTDTHWFVADTSQKWYSYTEEEQWWANAVSVDSTTEGVRSKYVNSDGTYNAGVELATSDMLAMFVWIPRYSYTIGCTSSSSCLGYKIDGASDLATATPGAIDIKFVDKNTTENYTSDSPTYTYTGESDRKSTNYYTHPAFNFGYDKLTGIWVGKFETSVDSNSDCYKRLINELVVGDKCKFDYKNANQEEDVMPRILPNVLSLVYQNVYNQFETALKLTKNTIYGLTGDSHMMKNSEWGAVAYLSQSIYGKYGNVFFEKANKEIFENNSSTNWAKYTGRSVGTYPSSAINFNKEGTYKYDDTLTTGSNKEDNKGTGASTTGNIYGIYDMSGGAYENVMGYLIDSSSEFGGLTSSNKKYNYSGFMNETKPETKYFDGYNNNDLFTKLTEVTGHATYETKEWYNDYSTSISKGSPWIIRGASASAYQKVGLFASTNGGGGASQKNSFRVVLVSP